MTTPADTPNHATDDELVPDYSRLGFRDLRKLCSTRGIPADGTQVQLIEKLKADDARRGLTQDDVPSAEEIDLLDDLDEPAEQPTAAGAGDAAASGATPPAAARPSASDDLAGPAVGRAPEIGNSPGAPAITTVAADGETGAVPSAIIGGKTGRPNLTARTGQVRVGEALGAAEVRAFRWEFVIGPHEVTDNDHFRMIAETHAQAAAAGLTTKGGITVGERVGFAADADNRRTAIYQVPLKRQR